MPNKLYQFKNEIMTAKQLSLFISISLWAILIGGIMYSHIVYMPAYLGHLPESNSLIRGAYGLKDENFWMTIHPFAIVSTIVSLLLNWRHKQRRKLISVTAIIYSLVIIATALYFVPALMSFAKSDQSGLGAATLYEQGRLWQQLSWLRGSFMFAGFLLLLVALTKTAEKHIIGSQPSYQIKKDKILETMEF